MSFFSHLMDENNDLLVKSSNLNSRIILVTFMLLNIVC